MTLPWSHDISVLEEGRVTSKTYYTIWVHLIPVVLGRGITSTTTHLFGYA